MVLMIPKEIPMVSKIVFALLLAFQFAVVANMASASVPPPSCFPCPILR
jgi:hypothetical protein